MRLDAGVQRKEFHRFLLKKLFYTLCYFGAAVLTEFIAFYTIGFGGAPSYWWLDLSVLFALCVFVYVIPGFCAQAVTIAILLLIQIALSVTNDALFGMSNMVFSVTFFGLVKEAGGAFSPSMLDYGLIAWLLLVFAAEIAALVLLRKLKVRSFPNLHICLFLVVFYCCLAVLGNNFYSLALDSLVIADRDDPLYIFSDDRYLWDTQYMPAKAYEKFGTFAFYYKNIDKYFSSNVANDEEAERASLYQFYSSGEWNSRLSPYEGFDIPMTGRFAGQNVVLIVIESGEWFGINGEYTPTLFAMASQGIAMTEYYSRDKTNHSEALSVLGSYPLESGITTITDHTLPFTGANVLGGDGYTTNYFHANDGGYYERNATHGALYGFDYLHFMDTMERLKGQYTKSEWYDFDSDSEVISQYLEDFTRSDDENGRFFTMMMSLFSHGEYEDLVRHGDYTADLSEDEKLERSQKYIMEGLERYYEKIDGYPSTFINEKYERMSRSWYDDAGNIADQVRYLRYKRYQAGLMDLDVGVNRLVHYLDERGELDNTLFVFYSDHNAYYNATQYYMKDVADAEWWNTTLYNVPFFFWSGSCMDLQAENLYEGEEYSNRYDGVYFRSVYDGEFYYAIDHRVNEPMGGVKIEKFCNTFDVLPTLLDLLGYDYNLNLYHGKSVFKDGESVFISREAGAFNDRMYSDGEKLYIMADTQEGITRSRGGGISFDGLSYSITIDGVQTKISAADAGGALSLYKGKEDYFVYEIAKAQTLLSDEAYAFLQDVSAYYQKQAFFETMYKLDYFKDKDPEQFVRKIS